MHKGVLAALWAPSPEVGSLNTKPRWQRQRLWLRKKLFFPVVLIRIRLYYVTCPDDLA